MTIAKAASRDVAFEAAKMNESVFKGQSDTILTQVATAGPSTHEEGLEVGRRRS